MVGVKTEGDESYKFIKSLGRISFYPYYPGIRAQISLNDFVDTKKLEMVSFAFKDSSAYSIEIQLDIANFDTVRPLLQEKMMRKGARIIFDQQEQNISKTYFVKISQDWYDERDERIQCQNYPTKKFNSYQECDASFVKKKIQNSFKKNSCNMKMKNGDKDSYLNFTPVYSTKNFSSVTEYETTKCPYNSTLPYQLFFGALTSNCQVPCTLTKTTTILANTDKSSYEEINIYFGKAIMVSSTTVDTFQLMEALNFFGSNFGLWPGLGIYQIIEWTFENIFWKIHKFMMEKLSTIE